ncbi:MAG TPA: histidine kinase [Armatimonadetes bacterium]|nr:histidine kinase [Armatimonadota bacterium]
MEFSFVQELIHKLKTFQAMREEVVTATTSCTLRDVQGMMRQHRISGVPVVEDEHLLGIVTIEDILRALEHGYIDDPVRGWMTKQVVTVGERWPLTETMSVLDRTGYGRLPVLSAEGKFIGLVTSDSILHALLVELERLLGKDEERAVAESAAAVPPPPAGQHWEFEIPAGDYDAAGLTSVRLKRELASHGVPPEVQRRVAIATYEAEANLIIHTTSGGRIVVDLDERMVRIVVQDDGPGIEDTEMAMRHGWSTASDLVRSLGFGAGLGLPNIRKCADGFQIHSEMGRGTRLDLRFDLPEDTAGQSGPAEGKK